ncbi:MAG: hypothetical protein KDD76_04285 [Rickettsiales bacterium]|nr:hypothetical protein [Rickettsiales bacterium]
MEFSRQQPSKKYIELVAHYRQMHEQGYVVQDGNTQRKLNPEDVYPGNELPRFAQYICNAIKLTEAETILDYGAGKGRQYGPATVTMPDGKTYESIPAYWGVKEVRCYDPAVAAHDTLPDQKYDGVVSTDMLEHCSSQDVPWIVEEMFSLANKFVFVNVSCVPAKALLPTGENAHCTLRSADWWNGLFTATANRFPGVKYFISCIVPDPASGANGLKMVWYERANYGE